MALPSKTCRTSEFCSRREIRNVRYISSRGQARVLHVLSMSWPVVELASWDHALLLAWSRDAQSRSFLTFPAGSVLCGQCSYAMAAHRGTSEGALSTGTSVPFVPRALRTSGGVIHPSVFLPAPICFCLRSSTFSFLFAWISSLGCWQLAKCCSSFSLSRCSVFFSIKMEK